MRVTDNARRQNRKSSNSRKIARMARILTKFGPNKLQRPKLSREQFSWNSLGCCDLIGQNFVKIRAIITIFRPFEDFRFSQRALSITHINYWELPLDAPEIFWKKCQKVSMKFWQFSNSSTSYPIITISIPDAPRSGAICIFFVIIG